MSCNFRSRVWAIVIAMCLADQSFAADPKPVKVFILAGQSNMEGQAVTDLTGKDYNQGRGTLNALLDDPAKAPLMKHLRAADGKWTVRDDVWCRYKREQGPLLAGPLTMGFSVYGDSHHFGPELQLGHVLGDLYDNPVLLIKTAWGGKSLYVDFRPPSSGGKVGPYYTKMVTDVREALANLKTDFPSLTGGYELAGFVWYHGWNDGVDPKNAVPQYEENLVNLIHDVRKEFNAPQLPVIVGEITGPWVEAPPEWTKLRQAQATAAARPEFRGNVLFVETHDFVRKPEDSPNPGHGHHEFGNAETYFLVGDALGKGLKSLLTSPPKVPAADTEPPTEAKAELPQPTSRTKQEIAGWTIRVDDRLMEPAHEELRTRALKFLEAKFFEIKAVVPAERVKELQTITIVLDLNCGGLRSMQYHPDAGWLKSNGYPADLAQCVHLPRAADVATRRNINEQPWVILHELAHAYHDQKLTFDDPQIIAAYDRYKGSGHGDATLLYNGKRVKHYALTNHKEFFAEMTESFFGVNDFFPFNRAELMETEPELYELLSKVWNPQVKKTP